MQDKAVTIGVIRAQLAFHSARLAHIVLERSGKAGDGDASLAALLEIERRRFQEGSVERHEFDQVAADPWSDLQAEFAEPQET